MLLDVPSGSIFSLDERVYNYLQVVLADPSTEGESVQRLTGLDAQTITEIEGELEQLVAAGSLFTQATQPTEEGSVLILKLSLIHI